MTGCGECPVCEIPRSGCVRYPSWRRAPTRKQKRVTGSRTNNGTSSMQSCRNISNPWLDSLSPRDYDKLTSSDCAGITWIATDDLSGLTPKTLKETPHYLSRYQTRPCLPSRTPKSRSNTMSGALRSGANQLRRSKPLSSRRAYVQGVVDTRAILTRVSRGTDYAIPGPRGTFSKGHPWTCFKNWVDGPIFAWF